VGKLKDKTSKATFRHRDVDVVLDREALGLRDDLAEAIRGTFNPTAENDSRLGLKPETAKEQEAMLDELERRANDSLVTLRIYQLPQHVWNKLVAENPPREGNKPDQLRGYHVEHITRFATEGGAKLLEDGEEETIDAADWADFWPKLDGGQFDRITEAIVLLNETSGWAGTFGLKKG
jgi:hypothetical protein